MKTKLFYLLAMVMIIGCTTPKSVLNSRIYQDMGGNNSLIELRKRIDYLSKFNYSIKSDTVYVMEGDIELCVSFNSNCLEWVQIWNKNKSRHLSDSTYQMLSYIRNGIEYAPGREVDTYPSRITVSEKFVPGVVEDTDFMRELVSEWNISEIKECSTSFTESYICGVCGYRIIFNKGEYKIDKITFSRFGEWERIYHREKHKLPNIGTSARNVFTVKDKCSFHIAE